MQEDYVFKTKPFAHQRERFYKYRDKEYHAHEWEQGTGKSKLIIDTACWLHGQGQIDALFIVSKNGVHRNWILNEVPTHMPDYVEYDSAFYASSPRAAERDALKRVLNHTGLKIVAQNVESLSSKKGVDFLKSFLMTNRTLLVVDDADIKNHKAKRTVALIDLGVHAPYRRVLNGTPVTQGAMDVYSPYTFLDEQILGTSFYAFRNTYAIMKEIEVTDVRNPSTTRRVKVIDQFQNLDQLKEILDPHRDRVLKKDCLDLPEKLYQKRYVALSAKQRAMYDTLKKHLVAELDGDYMTTPMALTKLLRLQQIVGGFFVRDEEPVFDKDGQPVFSKAPEPIPISDTNNRVDTLMDIADETEGKAIIWARFRAEIALISAALRKKYGDAAVVEYHGGVDDKKRSENIAKFQTPNSAARFFVGHVQAGGKGLTLHAASTVVYFSNDFSLENRLQSEDRAHRIGQQKNVLYIDIVAQDTIDDKIVETLRSKKNVADVLTGDEPLKRWL